MRNYNSFYEEIFEVLGELTPLKNDCGSLCEGACCKGDEKTGMRLFPNEPTELDVIEAENGRLAVCKGSCDREKRPLACRIFPFFPTFDEGRIRVKIDMRAFRICPMAENSEEIRFDRDFLRAVRKVGRILEKDEACLQYIKEVSEEINQLEKLFGKTPKISKRI